MSVSSTSSAVPPVPALEDTRCQRVLWFLCFQSVTTAPQPTFLFRPRTSSTTPSLADQSDDDTQQILANRTTQIRKRWATAYSGQAAQAKRVVKRTLVDLKAGVTGNNVAVPVPLVDRGRGDTRNILGVIVNRNLETDQYTIAVNAGILNGSYSRNLFDFFNDVDQENQVSLCTLVVGDKGISNAVVVEQKSVRQIDVNRFLVFNTLAYICWLWIGIKCQLYALFCVLVVVFAQVSILPIRIMILTNCAIKPINGCSTRFHTLLSMYWHNYCHRLSHRAMISWKRPHTKQIANRWSYLTDCNFLISMLFVDSY